MTKMKFKSGERTFTIDTVNPDSRGYLKVIDDDTKAIFWLPKFIVDGFTYMFSWDRYRQDRDDKKVFESLNSELHRLKELEQSPNVKIGIEHMNTFIENLSL